MPLSRETLAGLFPAILTPLNQDFSIDSEGIARLVEHLIEGGAAGVVPLGGTGEYLALSPRNRVRVVETVAEAVRGRVPVIAGVLSPGFNEALEAGRDFVSAGADGIMLITPYYVKTTQDRIRKYVGDYAEILQQQVILYDIPYKTNVNLLPDIVSGMADDGSIVGIKVCSTEIDYFNRIVDALEGRIAILGGEDHLLALHCAMGASGGIHATANLFPRLWKRVLDRAVDGDLRSALAMQKELRELMDVVFSEGNPGPLKTAMRLIGIPVGAAMSPLGDPSEMVAARLEKIIPRLHQMERRDAFEGHAPSGLLRNSA